MYKPSVNSERIYTPSHARIHFIRWLAQKAPASSFSRTYDNFIRMCIHVVTREEDPERRAFTLPVSAERKRNSYRPAGTKGENARGPCSRSRSGSPLMASNVCAGDSNFWNHGIQERINSWRRRHDAISVSPVADVEGKRARILFVERTLIKYSRGRSIQKRRRNT